MAHRGRLTTAELARVFDEGRTLSHRWFTLRVLCPDVRENSVRWGIAVGKRMAGGGVERNRLRRRVAAAVAGVAASGSEWVVVQLRREGAGVLPAQLGQAIRDRLSRDRGARCTLG